MKFLATKKYLLMFLILLYVLSLSCGIWFLIPYLTDQNLLVWQGSAGGAGLIILVTFIYLIFRKKRKVVEGDETEAEEQVEHDGMRNRIMQQDMERALSSEISALRKKDLDPTDYSVFLLVGESDAGKSGFLKNSETEWNGRHKDHDHERLHSESERVDFFLSDNSLYVDPSAALCLPEKKSQSAHLLWEHLISLLRKLRPERPIDGLVMVINLSDLLKRDRSSLIQYSQQLRELIFHTQLQSKCTAPVSVIFTHMDKFKGFVSSFTDLPQRSRDDYLGLFFSTDKDNWHQEFSAETTRIHRFLMNRLGKLIISEPESSFRKELIEFASGWPDLCDKTSSFLKLLFSRNHFDPDLKVGGVFFTASASVDGPIQQEKDSFFTKNLVSQYLPDHSYLSRGRVPRAVPFAHKMAFAGISAAGLMLGGLVINEKIALDATLAGFQHQYSLSSSVEDSWNQFDQNSSYRSSRADTLLKFSNSDGFPWLSNTIPGLYPSVTELKQKINNRYQAQLEVGFESLLKQIIFEQLSSGLKKSSFRDVGNTRAVIKSLSNSHGKSDELVSRWFMDEAKRHFNVIWDKPIQKLYSQHIESYLKLNRTFNLTESETKICDRADKFLQKFPRSYIVLETMLEDSSLQLQDLNWHDQIAPHSSITTSDKKPAVVRGLFTLYGYRNFYEKKIDDYLKLEIERQIQGSQSKIDEKKKQELISELKEKVDDYYVLRYQQEWINTWKSLTITVAHNLSDAITLVRNFQSLSSQFTRLVDLTNEHVNFGYLDISSKNKLKDMPSGVEKVKTVATLVTNVRGHLDRLGKKIGSPFGGFRIYLRDKDEANRAFGRLDGVLERVAQSLAETVENGHDNRQKYQLAVNFAKNSEASVLDLKRYANSHRSSILKSYLSSLIRRVEVAVQKEAREYLNGIWNQEIGRKFNEVHKQLYPYAKEANSISFSQFNSFYGLNGICDQFFNNNLKELVSTSYGKIRWIHPVIQFDNRMIEFFENVRSVQKILYQKGSESIHHEFKLMPYYLSPTCESFKLTGCDRNFQYSHAKKVMSHHSWPSEESGLSSDLVASLIYSKRNKYTAKMVEEKGEWAFLRLIDQATSERYSNGSYLLKFSEEDLKIELLLVPQDNSGTLLDAIKILRSTEAPEWI